ncbi:hypothetical protein [uncultured Megamonas sp.]|uniref:hypothetical protein n=1 Tax=uncultured Megamonas sp. TaxID=286140 RepID=UPI00259BC05D|nr:hypothetical protein [uncultured Megamonas sp.]
MNKITVQDLVDIGLKGEDDDLIVLANNINILLEANDIKMLVDEVADFVMNGGTTLQQKYDELLEDYRQLSAELDFLESLDYD